MTDADLPRCAYCFGPIRTTPIERNGRFYHPAQFVGPGVKPESCADRDKGGAAPKQPKPITGQIDLGGRVVE